MGMRLKTLIAAAIAAAFAWPLAAGAQDKSSGGTSAGGDKASAGATKSDKAPGAASGGATKDDAGAEAMFRALDKDKDGYISKEEAKGTPHDKDFAKLDKNGDGKLSREEHAAAPEHAGKAKSSSTGSTSAPTSDSKPK